MFTGSILDRYSHDQIFTKVDWPSKFELGSLEEIRVEIDIGHRYVFNFKSKYVWTRSKVCTARNIQIFS